MARVVKTIVAVVRGTHLWDGYADLHVHNLIEGLVDLHVHNPGTLISFQDF